MKIKDKILQIFQANQGKNFSREQLAQEVGIAQHELGLFDTVLVQMKQEKLIYQNANGTYINKEETFEGMIRMHKKGFGFISVDDDSEDDFFVRQADTAGALDGDVVLFHKIKDALYPEKEAAKVIGIKQRANHRQVGTIVEKDKMYFGVELDNTNFQGNVLVVKKTNPQLIVGHKVVVIPEEYLPDNIIIARVNEILGHVNTPGIDILAIVKQYDIPTEFSPAVEEQVKGIPHEVLKNELNERKDIRKRLTITIDGADAKDLDDAVSLERMTNGNYFLSVHIADVSHYVVEDSPIDEEALLRGTSVYLADRVIPMLPVQLSNGICSLHPQVDRLAITAEMEIDERGLIINKNIYPSIIYSDERMTYDDVNKMLKTRDQALIERYQNIYPMLNELYALSKILRQRRYENGALDFAISEAKIIVDQTGKAVDIKVRTQDVAEQIIEQCMIVANEAIAGYFAEHELPFIYRVHGMPQDVKLDAFRQVASNMGVNVSKIKNTSSVKPKALQRLLETIKQKNDYNLLSTLLLRTMQKAEYSTDNIGHFGLAMRNYTHFTSPIRRYPDLVVHRLLRQYIFNEKQDEISDDKALLELKDIAHQTSVAERRAVDCERAVTSMKMAEYMEEHIGEAFTGVISGVINSGFFVELENLVEGKVPIETLTDDYYIYIPEQLLLFGRRTKKQYRMGSRIKVKVESANKELSEINFSVIEVEQRPRGKQYSNKKGLKGNQSNKTKMRYRNQQNSKRNKEDAQRLTKQELKGK